jgi:hypothetical protein
MSVFYAPILETNTQSPHEVKVTSTPITLVMTLAFRYLTPIPFSFNRDTNILSQVEVFRLVTVLLINHL